MYEAVPGSIIPNPVEAPPPNTFQISRAFHQDCGDGIPQNDWLCRNAENNTPPIQKGARKGSPLALPTEVTPTERVPPTLY